LQVLLGTVVLDQHDVGQAVSGAGGKLRLQLGLEVRLGEIDDVDVHVGMLGGIAFGRLSHGAAVKVRVPGPDSDVDGRRGGDTKHADAGERCSKRALPARGNAGHSYPPFGVYPHSPWEERSDNQIAAQDFSKFLPRWHPA